MRNNKNFTNSNIIQRTFANEGGVSRGSDGVKIGSEIILFTFVGVVVDTAMVVLVKVNIGGTSKTW